MTTAEPHIAFGDREAVLVEIGRLAWGLGVHAEIIERYAALGGVFVEHHHGAVFADLEEIRRHGFAHAQPVALGTVRFDPHHAPTFPAATKSIFSRTPQSGQHHVSGTSDHAVPAANPSLSSPATTS